MAIGPKIIFEGDHGRCESIQDFALLEMKKLKEDMAFQNLATGARRHDTKTGESIECRSAHGNDIVIISAPQPAKEASRPCEIRFELFCSNGDPVTLSRLSYLVLYDAALAPAYVYDATSESPAPIFVEGELENIFSVSTDLIAGEMSADTPFWAFYSCHEDTDKWGTGQIVRTGVRTQWPLRYRTAHQFQPEDAVFPGNLYRDVIPYGAFKFEVSAAGSDGETVVAESGIDFDVFDQDGDNVNSGDGVDYVLSQFNEQENSLSIYNRKISYPRSWPRTICEEEGKGFWVFILGAGGEEEEGDGSLLEGIRTVDRASRCDCESDTEDPDEEDEEEGGSGHDGIYSHISEAMEDGILQYKGKCLESEKGKDEDLILPLADLREDSLCEGDEAGGSEADSVDGGSRGTCANWLCLSLLREYDMANVTPDMLTHLSVAPVGTGGFVTKDWYEEATGEEADSYFREVTANSKGMAYGYGHDKNLGKNCWTLVLPGVSLDWNGEPTGLWLLKPMSDEEAARHEEDKDREEDSGRETDGMMWFPFSKVRDIVYNSRSGYYEINLGAHPANAYTLMYNCEKGILTMYDGECCFGGGGKDSARVSDQGGNYYEDLIPSSVIQFELKKCGKTLGEGDQVSSQLYGEDGRALKNKRLSYNKATGFWEAELGGKRACPGEGCEAHGVYVVAGGALYGAPEPCGWTDATEGSLVKPGEHSLDLCVACPGCADLIEIDGYPLDEYADHVELQGGETVQLTFESCSAGPCEDFVEALGDGLPPDKAGTFEDGGGDGERYYVTYNVSPNLCGEYGGGSCPVICGHALPCCCTCDEESGPSLGKVNCDPDTCLGKYRVEGGCPPFSIQRRDQDKDGNWSEWYATASVPGCDWEEDGKSACWFCQSCDCDGETSGCPDETSFEIKVVDSLGRESNAVSSDVERKNEGYEGPEPDPENPETVENSSSVALSVVGGVGPFTWVFLGGDDIEMGESTGRSNTFYAGPDACGSASARVTDSCDKSTTVSARILNGRWVLTELDSCMARGESDGSGCVTKGKYRVCEETRRSYCSTHHVSTWHSYSTCARAARRCQEDCVSSSPYKESCLSDRSHLPTACFGNSVGCTHGAPACVAGESHGFYCWCYRIDEREVYEWTC